MAPTSAGSNCPRTMRVNLLRTEHPLTAYNHQFEKRVLSGPLAYISGAPFDVLRPTNRFLVKKERKSSSDEWQTAATANYSLPARKLLTCGCCKQVERVFALRHVEHHLLFIVLFSCSRCFLLHTGTFGCWNMCLLERGEAGLAHLQACLQASFPRRSNPTQSS